MDTFFVTLFGDITYELSLLLLLLSLPDSVTLKQSNFTNHEINVMKNLASE